MLMILRTNLDSLGFGLMKDQGSDTTSKDVVEAQGTKNVPVLALDTTPPLSTGPAPIVSSPPAPSPSRMNLLPNQSFPTNPDL